MPEVQMRNGTVVEDARLGRLVSHHPRSRLFTLAERLAAEHLDDRPLRSYTWNPGITLNQNGWGGCVSWTLSYDLDAPPKRVLGQDDASALERYFRIQDRDEWAGSERPGAVPQMSGSSMRAGGDQLIAEGHYSRYDWADPYDPVKALRQVQLTLAWRGPVPLGTNWYEGMNWPDPDGFIHPTGRYLGGHSILMVGISLRRQAVRLKQSWGPMPLLHLSFHDLTRLLDEEGEAYSPTRVKVAL